MDSQLLSNSFSFSDCYPQRTFEDRQNFSGTQNDSSQEPQNGESLQQSHQQPIKSLIEKPMVAKIENLKYEKAPNDTNNNELCYENQLGESRKGCDHVNNDSLSWLQINQSASGQPERSYCWQWNTSHPSFKDEPVDGQPHYSSELSKKQHQYSSISDSKRRKTIAKGILNSSIENGLNNMPEIIGSLKHCAPKSSKRKQRRTMTAEKLLLLNKYLTSFHLAHYISKAQQLGTAVQLVQNSSRQPIFGLTLKQIAYKLDMGYTTILHKYQQFKRKGIVDCGLLHTAGYAHTRAHSVSKQPPVIQYHPINTLEEVISYTSAPNFKKNLQEASQSANYSFISHISHSNPQKPQIISEKQERGTVSESRHIKLEQTAASIDPSESILSRYRKVTTLPPHQRLYQKSKKCHKLITYYLTQSNQVFKTVSQLTNRINKEHGTNYGRSSISRQLGVLGYKKNNTKMQCLLTNHIPLPQPQQYYPNSTVKVQTRSQTQPIDAYSLICYNMIRFCRLMHSLPLCSWIVVGELVFDVSEMSYNDKNNQCYANTGKQGFLPQQIGKHNNNGVSKQQNIHNDQLTIQLAVSLNKVIHYRVMDGKPGMTGLFSFLEQLTDLVKHNSMKHLWYQDDTQQQYGTLMKNNRPNILLSGDYLVVPNLRTKKVIRRGYMDALHPSSAYTNYKPGPVLTLNRYLPHLNLVYSPPLTSAPIFMDYIGRDRHNSYNIPWSKSNRTGTPCLTGHYYYQHLQEIRQMERFYYSLQPVIGPQGVLELLKSQVISQLMQQSNHQKGFKRQQQHQLEARSFEQINQMIQTIKRIEPMQIIKSKWVSVLQKEASYMKHSQKAFKIWAQTIQFLHNKSVPCLQSQTI